MFNIPSTSYAATYLSMTYGYFPTPTTRSTRSGSGDSAASTTSISTNATTTSISDSAISSLEFGELAELPSTTEIVKTLECPVCKEISFPPIYNCVNGHSVCGTCRPKLLHCALCKANYSESRNYSLESLVHNCKFHCHYKVRGCSQIVSGENYRDHLRNCTCRPGAGIAHICRDQAKASSRQTSSNSSSGDDDEEAADDSSYISLDVEDFEVVSWVKCKNGQYPLQNAIIAGYSAGLPVFVARAYQGSNRVLGRMIPSEKAAYVYLNGCRKKWYYEILVGVPETVKWIDSSWGDVPVNSVVGCQVGLETVYIARALRNGQYIPGFVQPSLNGCFIGVGLQVYLCHDYQVLVVDL